MAEPDYTNKSSAHHPLQMCGCQSPVSDLFPTSQVKDQRDDGFLHQGVCSKGLPCGVLLVFCFTTWTKTPPWCLWRRLNSRSPAVRGRPCPGRGAALLPPAAVLGPVPVQDPSRGVGPRGPPPHRTPAEWLTSCSSQPPWQGGGQEDHNGKCGSGCGRASS